MIESVASSHEPNAVTAASEPRDDVPVRTADDQLTLAHMSGGKGGLRAAGIPGYEILRVLGRGGMGVVYQARDQKLNRVVALKTIIAGAHASDTDLRRFRTEAEAVARVQHPNIVQIFEVGTHDGLPFFSMEFCGGGTLAARLDGTPRPPDEAANLTETLAFALAAAHSAGVIHRDLKPGNILLSSPKSPTGPPSTAASGNHSSAASVAVPPTDADRTWSKSADWGFGTPKIGDFGLAKLLDTNDDSRTRTGAVMGTPSYMAPEQAFGDTKHIGTAVDVYSLGAILYEMLTGRPPFKGATAADTLDRVRHEEPAPPRLLAKVPRDLETICLKALQKDPARRYATAAAMAEDLGRYRDGRPILARPVGPIGRVARWARRNPRVAALTGSAILLLVATAAVSTAFALSLSNKNRVIGKQNEEIAQRNELVSRSLESEKAAREEAQGERALAVAQAERNMKLVRFILWDVTGLLRDARLAKLRETLLNRTFAELERYSSEDGEAGRFADRGRMSIAMQLGELYLGRALQEEGAARQKAFTSAAAHYRRAHEVAKRLFEAEPDSPKAKGNLAVTHSALGKLYYRAGLYDKAKAELEESRRLRQEIVDNPGAPGLPNSLQLADVRNSLADSYAGLGDLASRQNDKKLAREHIERAAALRGEALKLVEADPANSLQTDGAAAFRRDLAATLVQAARDLLGDNSPAAFRKVEEQLAEAERLFSSSPDYLDVAARRELARILALVGDHYLFHTTDADAALHFYQRSQRILEAVRPLDDSRDVQSDVAMGHYRLGTAWLRLKKFGEASVQYRLCLAIREEHFKTAPTERAKHTLMVTLARAGEVKRAVELIEEVRPATMMPQELPFNAACTYALCAWAVGGWKDDAELSPADLRARKDLVAKALAEIRELFRLHSPWAGKIETDPDLEFLHGRDEFKELVAQMKKPAPNDK